MRQDTTWWKLIIKFVKIWKLNLKFIIHFPPVTLNMFRMTVWTISMEALWPNPTDLNTQINKDCLVLLGHTLFISINWRLRRKLFVRRPPHFCSSELHTDQFVFSACLNNVFSVRKYFQITNKTIRTSSSNPALGSREKDRETSKQPELLEFPK